MTPDLQLDATAIGIVVGLAGALLALYPLPDGHRAKRALRRLLTHRPSTLQAAIGGAAGTGTFIFTRWPVAAVLAGVAAMSVPAVLGQTASGRVTRRVEAVASWTELLRDSLSAAAGLGQAIVSTAPLAPAEIRVPVTTLAERLVNGVPVDAALRAFAAEVDDPSADVVVCALLMAAANHSQKLAELLGVLADNCRQDVAMRLRVEASRASARSSVRTVVVFSLGFAGLLFVLAHSYLAPFGTAAGQTMLATVGAFYGIGLWLMVRMVQPRPIPRLLAEEPVR
ncbi:MAG: type II secretion system F family protein [Acidimicrobiales bacterium]